MPKMNAECGMQNVACEIAANGNNSAFSIQHSAFSNVVKVFEKGIYNFGTPEEQDFINDHFVDCPNISIDYGVMEKSPNTFTIPADFGWSDIGTWGSLFTHAKKDESGNAVRGKVVTVDNKNTIINIEEGSEAVVEGLEDYLVAYRDHSLLVCKLHDEQQIKIWIEGLK